MPRSIRWSDRQTDRRLDEQKAVKPERAVCLICVREYVLEYVLRAAVGRVARRRRGAACINLPRVERGLASSRILFLFLCVRESRLASDDKPHRTANHPTQPASSLDPCAAPGAPSVLAYGPPLAFRGPACQQCPARQEPGCQETARRGKCRCMVCGRAGRSCERASVQRTSKD